MANQKNAMSVSVVIPAYNSDKYLLRSLDSVFAQTRLPDEVIVVDDGSSDNTAQVAAGFSDKIIFIQQENAGASAARNAGIKAAKSNWIAFLDADDEWLPKYLESQIQLLSSNPKLVWSTGNYYTRLASSAKQSAWNDSLKCKKQLGCRHSLNYFKAYSAGIRTHTDTTIVEKETLLRVGGFIVTQKTGEDVDLWFRLAYYSPEVGYNIEPLAVYYLDSEQSLVASNRSIDKDQFIKRHLELSRKSGREADFLSCATDILKMSYRAMFFAGNAKAIRLSLARFSYLFPMYEKLLFWLLTISPKFTQKMCFVISSLVRLFGARRRVVRKAYKRK